MECSGSRVVVGRLDSKQVFPEEILPSTVPVATSVPMSSPGDEHELEILRLPHERIDQAIGGFRWDVLVQFPHDQHELSLQAMGVVDIGRFRIVGTDGIPHPLLVPGCLVHAVVVAPAG